MLADRLFSSFFLIASFIAAIAVSHDSTFFVITMIVCNIMVILGIKEFYSFFNKSIPEGERISTKAGLLAGSGLITISFVINYLKRFYGFERTINQDSIFVFVSVLTIFAFEFNNFRKKRPVCMNFAVSCAGLIYVAWLFTYLLRILYFPGINGRSFIFYLILLSKANDACAYFVGSAIGRTRLAQWISPKKTIEGSIAGMAGTFVLAWLGNTYFFNLGLTFSQSMVLALGIGIATQVGDLSESLLKRDAGVKDSGSILPGIGGVLDLLDGILFSAPVMYLFLLYQTYMSH